MSFALQDIAGGNVVYAGAIVRNFEGMTHWEIHRNL